MENKLPTESEISEYREYLEENSHIVSQWPEWMKSGARSDRKSANEDAKANLANKSHQLTASGQSD